MIILEPGRLAALGEEELDALSVARQCVVAVAEGKVRGTSVAALLMADFAAAHEASTIIVDSPVAWAGGIWRLGDQTLRLLIGERTSRSASRRTSTSGDFQRLPVAGSGDPSTCAPGGPLSAARARELGLIDEIFSGDWNRWLERWLAHRSAVALDSAAVLTGRRGGDALERAEFARLFATGEPQHGMEAFLGKRRPFFGGELKIEN